MQDLVDPIQRRRIVDARVLADRLEGFGNDVCRYRHIRLNMAKLMAAIQGQRRFVRLAGVPTSADGVLTGADQQH